MMQCDYLFATPVWSSLKESNDFSGVADFALKLEKDLPSESKSNRGGWQSPLLNLDEHPPLFPVRDAISRATANALHDMQLKDRDTPFVISNVWININRAGDFNMTHCHPNSFLSGCAYIQVPPNSGGIVFRRSDAMQHYDVPEIDFHALNAWHCYAPSENQVFLFPGWVFHDVEPNKSEEPRISIAFNINRKY